MASGCFIDFYRNGYLTICRCVQVDVLIHTRLAVNEVPANSLENRCGGGYGPIFQPAREASPIFCQGKLA
jgi:hypothetical protein